MDITFQEFYSWGPLHSKKLLSTSKSYMWVIVANNTVFKMKTALINILFGDNCKFTCKKQYREICILPSTSDINSAKL